MSNSGIPSLEKANLSAFIMTAVEVVVSSLVASMYLEK